MKKEMQANLLQYFSQAKAKKKSTWAEVLIAIIVAGIGTAIALPSFSRPVNSTRSIESQAKQYCGSMNRAQQAYFLEKGKFTTRLADLGIGISRTTPNHTYSIRGNEKAVANNCLSRKNNIRSFIGVVAAGERNGETITYAVLCRSDSPGVGTPQDPIVAGSNPPEPKCPSGYSQLR